MPTSKLIAPLAGLALLAGSLGAAAHETTVGSLIVSHAWSRPAPANRPMAAYMTIINEGTQADRLVGASSPKFKAAELHTVEQTNGVMVMQKIEAIAVEADSVAELAPRGLHIMLFGAEARFGEGERFPLVLEFEQAGQVTVDVMVEKRSGATQDTGHDNHGGHGNHGSGG